MIVIRRAQDRTKSYTVIMLPGEPVKWIPTSDYEHQRILEIFKQDKPYEGIENDFTDFKELYPAIANSVTKEEYVKTVTKQNTDFLKSALDKEKNRPTIDE